MNSIVFASRNAGKVVEAKKILAEAHLEVISLNQTEVEPEFDVAETGSTTEANARLKAEGFGQKLNQAVIADDSGLEVDALDGRPGVYSKRYGTDDEHRNQKLLQELIDVPEDRRTAQFVSVVCYFDPGTQKTICAHGEVKGKIAFEPLGSSGFGYDPIFIPDEGDGRTFAQLGQEFKNKVSHRGRALRRLLVAL